MSESSSTPMGWVTLDCFGTLVDWRTGFARILRPVAGDKTLELQEAYHQFEPQVQAERPFRPYKDVLTQSLRLAAHKVGLKLSERQARLLSDCWGSTPVFGDVEPALAALRAAGFKLGVLTNCDDDLFALSERSFLQPFDCVVTAERARDYKPAHSHFSVFEQETGVSRAEWVHVANSWFHDLAPARELGIQCIWLDRDRIGREPAAAPCVQVFTATGLPRAVASLHASLS